MRLPVSQQMTDRNQARQISYITKKHKKLVCFLVSYTPLADLVLQNSCKKSAAVGIGALVVSLRELFVV